MKKSVKKKSAHGRPAAGGWRLCIITGLSGAGKSQALKIFEDFRFFCVDNLPVALIGAFVDRFWRTKEKKNVALGLDMRGREFVRTLPALLTDLGKRGIDCRTFFLDASDQALIQRFSETRHRHPLGSNVVAAIGEERRMLADVKGLADKVIDTSDLTLGELKENLSRAMALTQVREMTLSIVSFGFKYGIPLDADLVMDVRFLPNPYYRPKLKKKSGLDRPVQEFILRHKACKKFLDQYSRLVKTLLPYYIRAGKSYLTVAIGCTGGRHRSVFITNALARALSKSGHKVSEFHRDLGR